MRQRYSVLVGFCFWLILISFGFNYFASDLSRLRKKQTAIDKSIVTAGSTESRLDHFPALKKYIESLRSIPAGKFDMGSATGRSDERPVHSVILSSFRMGATPITVAVWKEYCRAEKLKMPMAPKRGWKDDHPMVNVSWEDIMGSDGKGGFCAWASRVAGFSLTLPTEAQFEYASRGGQVGLNYPWGNSFDDSKLWCSRLTVRLETAPVYRTSNIFRNKFGLSDMSGNVFQWCSDQYGEYEHRTQTNPLRQPLSSKTDNRRCVRGGPWYEKGPNWWRCAFRFDFYQDMRYPLEIGFRLSAGPG